MPELIEACPRCHRTEWVRRKLVLIDKDWRDEEDQDPRRRYHVDLRVDNLVSGDVREPPLEQFVEGFYCEDCKKAFVSDSIVKGDYYRCRWP